MTRSTLEENGFFTESSSLLNGTTLEGMSEDAVHNDPAVCDTLRGTSLRGSTLLFARYQEQHKSQRSIERCHSSGSFSKSERMAAYFGSGARSERVAAFLVHVNHSFFADAKALAEGTIPQSIVVALVIGILCGVVCFIYNAILQFLLEFLWHTLPAMYVIDKWHEAWYVAWIPIMVFSNAILVGLSVVFLGEPGDLAFTIGMVHDKAFIPMDHVSPMATASLFSMLAGGSLGPEAPLVAICGALGGFVSRKVFGQRTVNVVRKHTLMGMAGALAAFFGVPLGGSLFALEVNSRFGIEYFEHMVEAVFCGEVSLIVYRVLSGLPIAPIWDLGAEMTEATPLGMVVGGAIGLIGAAIAYLFATFHWRVMDFMGRLNLLENKYAVYRALVGATIISVLAMLVPQTAFWGEMEFLPIATMAPSSGLPHIWPPSGLIGFEMDTWWKALIVGCANMIAISFTVAAGFRGGFIFPFFATGAAFGRVLGFIFPRLPLQLATLCMAAGINVAITRTSLASPLILSFLAGEPLALPAILAASLCSLFATSYMTFIKTQIARSDIDHSLYHHKSPTTIVDEFGESDEIDDD